MEDMSLSGLDNTKLEALAHDIYSDLVEDACLGLCFEVHRAVKQGYFFLDDTDQESMKDFGVQPQEYSSLTLRSSPGEVSRNGPEQQSHRQPQVNSHNLQFSELTAFYSRSITFSIKNKL
uniref:Ataxin 7 like 3 n=1 Tax=Astyanax mexicanus TaxID=7994 RepID=A0A8B9JGD4_ASTMX